MCVRKGKKTHVRSERDRFALVREEQHTKRSFIGERKVKVFFSVHFFDADATRWAGWLSGGRKGCGRVTHPFAGARDASKEGHRQGEGAHGATVV